MGNELMAGEVEVDPMVTAAALVASEQIAVELSGGVEIVNGDVVVSISGLIEFSIPRSRVQKVEG